MSVSSDSTCIHNEDDRLDYILSCPKQLAYFQAYLQDIYAHENLLFIEALSELRHENFPGNIEAIVMRYCTADDYKRGSMTKFMGHRIWKTFLAHDSQLEINVYGKEEINQYLEAHKWGIISKDEAIRLFSDAEREVKQFLVKILTYKNNESECVLTCIFDDVE